MLGIVRTGKKIKTENIIMAIYNAVACFHLEYCLLLWCLHLEKVTLDLERVQKALTVVRHMGRNGLLHEE